MDGDDVRSRMRDMEEVTEKYEIWWRISLKNVARKMHICEI